MKKTRVLFLIHPPEGDHKEPELFAYFPDLIHNGLFRTSYAHIGQHSSCHPEYAKESKEASPEQYAALKAELESIGYDLRVMNKKGRTINQIITEVNCQYGAPMGRPSNSREDEPKDQRIYDCAVPMVSTGEYDRGGAYWGLGRQLRVRYTKDLTYIHF